MADFRLDSAVASDMTNNVTAFSVTALDTDGVSGGEETEWQNSKWSTYWGYFTSIPDLNSAIIMKAIWNVGKGYTADPRTQVILDHIDGWGKDTFEDIIFNMEVIKRVGGDAFAEIIRDKETGILINLKVLDPGTIKIIVDKKGIIKRYEQTSKLSTKELKQTFKPENIFHLSNNRLADQIHGISSIDALESNIKANAESFADIQKIMHRQARPMIMFKLKTDDATKINTFVGKMDQAVNKGENIYIPDDENTVEFEVIQVNVGESVMTWRDDLRNTFYRAVGLPQIVTAGAGQSTESESKTIYLAFEQVVEKEQKALERQIWEQLNLRINFIPPATLQQQLQTDSAKDASQGIGFQPNELTAGVGR